MADRTEIRDADLWKKRSNFWTVPVQNLIRNWWSKGELSPVFFGSALTNFGVETFLEAFSCR